MSTDGGAIARHLERVQGALDRVEPDQLAAEMARGALVVDTRPAAYRATEGELPGAVVVERIHLEWRLDPTSPDRLPEVVPDQRVVIVCNEGYSSSLAAATAGGIRPPIESLTTDFQDADVMFGAWLATLTTVKLVAIVIETTEGDLVDDLGLQFETF